MQHLRVKTTVSLQLCHTLGVWAGYGLRWNLDDPGLLCLVRPNGTVSEWHPDDGDAAVQLAEMLPKFEVDDTAAKALLEILPLGWRVTVTYSGTFWLVKLEHDDHMRRQGEDKQLAAAICKALVKLIHDGVKAR